jgi:hypothetical protein
MIAGRLQLSELCGGLLRAACALVHVPLPALVA